MRVGDLGASDHRAVARLDGLGRDVTCKRLPGVLVFSVVAGPGMACVTRMIVVV